MERIRAFIFILFLALGACVESAEVTLKNSEPRLIVEGKVQNGEGPFEVKLSLSTDFFHSEAEYIEEAIVTISDDAGNSEQLEYNDSGIFLAKELKGTPGNTYHLTVDYQGKLYEAWSKMPKLPEIEAIEVVYYEKSFLRKAGYYIGVRGIENKIAAGFYRSLIYKGDSLYNPLGRNDLFAAIDEEEGNGISRIDIPFPFELGDSVTLEIVSMDREAYIFYQSFLLLLTSDGGLFGSPPANPEGNISNGALGLFQAVSAIRKEVYIE